MNERSGQKWIDARYNCVTSTDIGKIMGCDDSCSRRMLMDYKLNKIDPQENTSEYTKLLLKLGSEFESAALSECQLKFRNHHISSNGFIPGMTPHPEMNWLTGTPDYIMDHQNGYKCVVEVKTHWNPTPEEARPIQSVETIPLKYWLQIQAYMEILNFDYYGYLWSWTINNGSRCYRIRRDKKFWLTTILPEILLFRNIFEGLDPNIDDLLFKRGQKGELVIKVRNAMVNSSKLLLVDGEFRNHSIPI